SGESRDFWLERLADRPGTRLPRRDGPAARGIGETVQGERHEHDENQGHGTLTTPISRELLTRLEDFARRCGVPFKTVVLAAHLRALSLATGSPDVVTGLSSDGRLEEADATDARGLFLNTLPFRIRLPEGTWQDLARAVFDAERELLPHRRYPMSAMQRALGGPLFEVSFVYNHFHQFGRLAEDAPGGADTPGVGRTHFPLLVTSSRENGGLRLGLEYDAREFSGDQAVTLRDYHLRALESMTADPEAPHHAVSLLGEAERELLAAWAGGADRFEAGLVHDLVARWAEATPDAVAVTCGEERLTYRELNARANALAHHLRTLGVGPEVPVAVCVERSAETVIATLAVMKAAGVYVPLEPDFPAERMEFMLRDVGARLVLVAEGTGELVPEGPWQTLDLNRLPREGSHDDPEELAAPGNGCYVIFTSGSTGRPKGTLVTHANVTRLFQATAAAGLDAGPADVWTLFHSFAFDFSVWEMWGALTTGGRVVVAPH